MKNFIVILLLASAVLFSCKRINLIETDPPPVNDTTALNLTDNQSVFTNPGMGWNLMYYTFDGVCTVPAEQQSDLLSWVPCDIISFRLSWAAMEPQEGQYNWNIIDDVAAPWIAAGKRITFKFYTNFLWDNADRQATPLWVKDAGADGRYIDGDGNPSNDAWVAYYGDPVLLQKLGNFYAAAAQHYQNSPVEFIELGSIGRVGEGTSYQMGGIEPSESDLKKHIDLLRNAFPTTQLIINDDYEMYACQYAKSVGYGVDDHSIGVGGTAGDPNNPGRPYNKWIIGGEGVPDPYFQDGTVPIGLENETWFQIDDWYLQQMIDAKANYCRIHQNPGNLMDPAVQDVLKNMNLKMGYRIQFPEIIIPNLVTKGEVFSIDYSIKNAGAGYLLKDCYPMIVVKDESGQEVISAIDGTFNARSLKSAADNIIINGTVTVNIPVSANGKSFSLFIAMANSNKQPLLNLPYNDNDGNKQYLLKQIATR